MVSSIHAGADVFSVREIARAAEVSVGDVRAAIARLRLPFSDEYLPAPAAVACVRALRDAGVVPAERALFFFEEVKRRRFSPAALAASTGLHLAMLALAAFIATLEFAVARPQTRIDTPRLVFLATPGPGGGGGGGGLRQPERPPAAKMTGPERVKSPVPPPKPLTTRKPEPRRITPPPPAPDPRPKPIEPLPPAPRPELIPQVVAPVVTASSDAQDRAGLLTETGSQAASQGPGTGGGVGTGSGSGIGEGDGAGIGPGSGGGTGGGPYRGGSGITAPDLLQEIRPDYTDDARRQGIEGDVILEIVVRRDGSVGDVKVLRGLGGGLDRRAVDAVRRWRFSPARRYGTPVDVIVEVAVEFKLR